MFSILCRRWWVLLLRGILAILLGINAAVWPGITLQVLMFVYGAFALLEGVAGIMLGFGGGPNGKLWWPMILIGVISLAAGLVAIFYPGLTAMVLVMVIGVTAVMRGVLEISAAIALRKEIDDEWVLILSGMLSVCFGGLLLARPGEGALALVLLIGAYMIAVGIMAVALALRLRHLGRKLKAA